MGAFTVISAVKLVPETFIDVLEETEPKQAVNEDNVPATVMFGELLAAIITV